MKKIIDYYKLDEKVKFLYQKIKKKTQNGLKRPIGFIKDKKDNTLNLIKKILKEKDKLKKLIKEIKNKIYLEEVSLNKNFKINYLKNLELDILNKNKTINDCPWPCYENCSCSCSYWLSRVRLENHIKTI